MTKKFKNCTNSPELYFLDITEVNEKVNSVDTSISHYNFEISGSWKEADILPPLSIQGIFVVFFF